MLQVKDNCKDDSLGLAWIQYSPGNLIDFNTSMELIILISKGKTNQNWEGSLSIFNLNWQWALPKSGWKP